MCETPSCVAKSLSLSDRSSSAPNQQHSSKHQEHCSNPRIVTDMFTGNRYGRGRGLALVTVRDHIARFHVIFCNVSNIILNRKLIDAVEDLLAIDVRIEIFENTLPFACFRQHQRLACILTVREQLDGDAVGVCRLRCSSHPMLS